MKHQLGTIAIILFIAAMIFSSYAVIERMKLLYHDSLKGDLTHSLIDLFH